MSSLRLAGIIRESITDGPGIRFTVFAQGCPHGCLQCHNPQTWDFDGGTDVEVDKIAKKVMENPMIKGVTFSGGEPFCQAEGFLELAKVLKEKGIDIVIFTGYLYEELMASDDKNIHELLKEAWLVIDGPFDNDKKDLSLKFRGSSNQRIIDSAASIKAGKIILANEYMV